MLVILATWEAEIRRIKVGTQPWPNNLQDSVSKISNTKRGSWNGSSGRLLA
jgi:hypothetical protein